MKKCEECKEIKSLDQFYNLSRNKDSKENKCKRCRKAKNNLWYKQNKEKHAKSSLPASIKRRFGISIEEYKSKLQNNTCSICKSNTDLVLDHNHITSKIRGVLCRKCNAALGLFKDNKNILREAILYLEQHE